MKLATNGLDYGDNASLTLPDGIEKMDKGADPAAPGNAAAGALYQLRGLAYAMAPLACATMAGLSAIGLPFGLGGLLRERCS